MFGNREQRFWPDCPKVWNSCCGAMHLELSSLQLGNGLAFGVGLRHGASVHCRQFRAPADRAARASRRAATPSARALGEALDEIILHPRHVPHDEVYVIRLRRNPKPPLISRKPVESRLQVVEILVEALPD